MGDRDGWGTWGDTLEPTLSIGWAENRRWKIVYGSVSAGREIWLFRVIFFKKVEPLFDQT